MKSKAQTLLFLGYKPEYIRAIERLVREYAHPSDIMRVGPSIHMDDVKVLSQFVSMNAVDSSSQGRVALLNMEQSSRAVQTALLILTETPPAGSLIVMHCPNRQGLLPTIVSRCDVHTIPTPPYGALLVDLRRLGMPMDKAVGNAQQMMRGLTLDQVPDDSAVSVAEGLTDAVRLADIELGLKYAGQFDHRALAALRQRLATKFPAMVAYAYTEGDPKTVAIRVFHALLSASVGGA